MQWADQVRMVRRRGYVSINKAIKDQCFYFGKSGLMRLTASTTDEINARVIPFSSPKIHTLSVWRHRDSQQYFNTSLVLSRLESKTRFKCLIHTYIQEHLYGTSPLEHPAVNEQVKLAFSCITGFHYLRMMQFQPRLLWINHCPICCSGSSNLV